MKILIYSIAGALIGLLCRFPCMKAEQYLTEKRGLTYTRDRKTDLAALLLLELLGACIMFPLPTAVEAIYGFGLLITAEISAMMDYHHRIIPNGLILTLLGLRLVTGVPALFGAAGFPEFDPVSSLIGLAVGFTVFLLPSFFGKNVGAGDIKLAAAMGFCLGWQGALAAIVLMGLFVLGYTVLSRKMPVLRLMKTTIPMGPFLSAGMVAVFLLERFSGLSAIFG